MPKLTIQFERNSGKINWGKNNPPPQEIPTQSAHLNWLTRTPLRNFCAILYRSLTCSTHICLELDSSLFLDEFSDPLKNYSDLRQLNPPPTQPNRSALLRILCSPCATSWRNNSSSSPESLEPESSSIITISSPLHPFWLKLSSSSRSLKLDSSNYQGTHTTSFSLVCLAPTLSTYYNPSLGHQQPWLSPQQSLRSYLGWSMWVSR